MRAFSAVTRPSASHPAQNSARTGWRLGWTCSDSSRLNVHFTGRPSSQAARAVWVWLAQSSLPPKAPPLATRWTSTRSSPMPSTSAIWRRSSHTPWPPENTSRRAVVVGHRQGRLGLQEGVLDALGPEHLVHGVGAGGQGGVHVAVAGVGRAGQHVGLGRVADLPHGRLVRSERRQGVGERRQRPVVDLDQLGGAAGRGPVLRHHERQQVAGVGRPPADRDEHRPVPVDEPDAQLAGHVGRGQHPLDPGDRGGGAGVDGEDVGPGVGGQHRGGVQHPGDPQVVDVGLVAQRQVVGLVLGDAGADARTRGDGTGCDRRPPCPPPAGRRRRGSGGSRCTGTGGRRGGGRPSRG